MGCNIIIIIIVNGTHNFLAQAELGLNDLTPFYSLGHLSFVNEKSSEYLYQTT